MIVGFIIGCVLCAIGGLVFGILAAWAEGMDW